MAVKLDVLINYLFDNSKLKKNIAALNKEMVSAWSPYTRQDILKMGQKENLKEYFNRLTISAKQYNDVLENTLDIINNLNAKGKLSPLLRAMGIYDRDYLSEREKMGLAHQTAGQQIAELQAIKEEEIQKDREESNAKYKAGADSFLAFEEERERIEREEIKKRQREGAILDRLQLKEIHEQSVNDARLLKKQQEQQKNYWLARMDWEEEQAKKQAAEDEKKKRNLFNLMLGRWGKFGIAGIAVAKAIQLVSKAVNVAYNTSQQGLDWQRTISGGASGGNWFGQGLAAYQGAGIGANQYQGFKRGIQGYLGSVKLGMGNAAPLMYLGLSALGNPDELERELEKSLRRLPKDVSLALAGQMGLDYNIWEAIYSGRIDRDRSSYSEEAIKEWAELGRSLNDLVTTLNVFLFDTFAPMAKAVSDMINRVIDKKSGFNTLMNIGSGLMGHLDPTFNPLKTLIKFGALEIFVKNDKGDVISKEQAEITDTMYEIG